jgi:folate-binding protein YgfZ
MFINSSWKEFLSQHGAVFDKGVVDHFSDKTQELMTTQNANIIADLSHYGLIKVEGEEAESFLQNQFSNDVHSISPSQSQLSAYCSPKGRMLAGFQIFKFKQSYFLRLPASILETTLKRLRMYVLRSKVTLENASTQLARFGIAGTDSVSILQKEFSIAPSEVNDVVQNAQICIIRLPGLSPRFELHGEIEPMQKLFEQCSATAKPVGQHAWSWLAIKTGIPEVYPQTIDAFVPQMVNYAALNGINFKKGCYPGQEIVARMHYLGKLKRRMYLLHTDTNTLPSPGEDIYCKSSAEASCGKVVEAQFSPAGGIDLLAVVQIAKAEAEPLYIDSFDGTQLQMEELPYTVTNEA